MKIVHVVETYYPNVTGPSRIIHELSKRLVKKGVKVEVVTTFHKAGKAKAEQVLDGVRIRRFPVKKKVMQYMVSPDLKRHLERVKCDVIHCHNYRGYHTQVAYKVAKKRGIPFVLTPHGGLLGYDHYLTGVNKIPYKLFDAVTMKKAALDADAVIVLSKEEEKDARRYGLARSRVHRIPVGIDTSEYKPKLKKHKELRVLFVGRITRNRNLEPIIKAAVELKKTGKGKDIKFLIVGGEVKTSSTSKGGYIAALKQMAKDLGVNRRVKFVGPKYGKELREYYRTSDVFVYTSKSENFGMPILEAGAAGLPVISTDVGVASELIEDEKSGYLVKGNGKEVTSSLEKLTDKKQRVRFGNRILKKVKERFNWQKSMKKHLKTYNSII